MKTEGRKRGRKRYLRNRSTLKCIGLNEQEARKANEVNAGGKAKKGENTCKTKHGRKREAKKFDYKTYANGKRTECMK